MTIRLQNKNLYLTYMDPEEKIFSESILLTELAERLGKYITEYGIACKEIAPTTKTTHYHVLIICKKTISVRNGKSLLEVEGIMPHLEKVRNNLIAIIRYIKKDGIYAEFNKENAPKEKLILNKKEKADLMMNGCLEELFLNGTLGAIDVIRATKLKSIFQQQSPIDKFQKKLILWFYGETGEGKTRMATELADSFKSKYWMSNETLRWFDGFTGQEIAIIDDFRKSMLTDWSYLLRILDGYGLFVQIKGGFTKWNPKVVIITSPATPQQAFSWINKEGEEQEWDKHEQLIRRLTYEDKLQVYEFPLWDDKKEEIFQVMEKHLGRKAQREEFLTAEDWSIIEPEGFITPG